MTGRVSGVYLDGLRETVKALEAIGVETGDLKEVFTQVGEDVATDAKRIVRSVTGRTAANIRPAKAKNKAVVRAGSARIKHAGVLNYGWPKRGIRATGFLTKAANANTEQHIRTIEDGLTDLINQHMRSTP